MQKRKLLLNNDGYCCLGRFPRSDELCLFLHSWDGDEKTREGLVTSALEAKAAGFSVLSNLSSRLHLIADACLFTDNPLYVLLPYKRNGNFSAMDCDVFSTSGGFIFPEKRDGTYCLLNNFVLSYSQIIIFSGRADIYLAEAALDQGSHVFILRNSLGFENNKKLLKAGCHVINSLSDALYMPKSISFSSEEGRYRIGNRGYGVFNFCF